MDSSPRDDIYSPRPLAATLETLCQLICENNALLTKLQKQIRETANDETIKSQLVIGSGHLSAVIANTQLINSKTDKLEKRLLRLEELTFDLLGAVRDLTACLETEE